MRSRKSSLHAITFLSFQLLWGQGDSTRTSHLPRPSVCPLYLMFSFASHREKNPTRVRDRPLITRPISLSSSTLASQSWWLIVWRCCAIENLEPLRDGLDLCPAMRWEAMRLLCRSSGHFWQIGDNVGPDQIKRKCIWDRGRLIRMVRLC